MESKRYITKEFYLGFIGRLEEYRNKIFLCITLESSYNENKITVRAQKSDEDWHDYFCGCDPFLLCSNIREWLMKTSEFLPPIIKIEFDFISIEKKECIFIVSFFDIINEAIEYDNKT